MVQIIDGKQLAAARLGALQIEVKTLRDRKIVPTLAVVLVGDDPASAIYVRNKQAACKSIGIETIEARLPATITGPSLLARIDKLNSDDRVHAILVQLPLPNHIDRQGVVAAISPSKDVDGFHPENVGRLTLGLPGTRPCTALAVMALLGAAGVDPAGERAVVIGRGQVVGMPTALSLTHANATVTLVHSRTRELAEIVSESTIVVAAIGKPRYVRGEWIRPGATVIDVGITRLPDGTLAGDVDFAAARERAGAITPVPGGVGPVTIAMLAQNTIALAGRQI
ncbi:MAG: bifunctional 5,10-methylenetetrahydrofolate dehydrogenase/5,10-methenyltetrahydrofolate cyclohydrolase [Deltaproteobacteria bacterium]|nr:bifunctional 5,10-methylenetetrahydrofolate dehydrogenase/5,10-methenyltetrahydrofolate cyclohydrolase [Deltaproteobacteria bacterium]